MTDIKCRICRASNATDAVECFSCGAKFRRDGKVEPAPPSSEARSHASGPHPVVAGIASIVLMCISSYVLFWVLMLSMQSTRTPLLVLVALWISFLVALMCKRWAWVYSLALFPLPALYISVSLAARIL